MAVQVRFGPQEAVFAADCSASDSVGDLARLVTPTGSSPKVTVVDVTDSNKTPAVGIIVKKTSTTRCVVRVSGNIDLLPFGIVDLVPGKSCFVWFDGTPWTTYPGSYASGSGYAMIQLVGVAVSSSVLSLSPDLSRTKVFTAGMPPPPAR